MSIHKLGRPNPNHVTFELVDMISVFELTLFSRKEENKWKQTKNY